MTITTVTVFEYLILISIDFSILFLLFLLQFSFDWEDLSNKALKNVFDHISKHLEARENTLFSVFGSAYIPEFMKTGLANLTQFLCNFSQLRLSNISLVTVLFTADFVFFLFFVLLLSS